MFNLRLHDMFLQEWNTSLSNTSHCRLFKLINHEFDYKSYLNINKKECQDSFEQISSQFSFISDRKRGWGKILVVNRKGALCGVLEEFQCVIVYPRFNNESEYFINKDFSAKPNNFDVINLFKQRNHVTHFNLAVLCYRIKKEYRQFI